MLACGGSRRCSCGREAEEEGPGWAALTLIKDREHTFLPRTPRTSTPHPRAAAHRFESTGSPECKGGHRKATLPGCDPCIIGTPLLCPRGVCDHEECMYLWAWLWGMEEDNLYVANVGP